MTEDEAKTKWCHRGGRAALSQETCIASACMAWRWEGPRKVQTGALSQPGSSRSEPIYETRDGRPGHGFCGLAGAPQ